MSETGKGDLLPLTTELLTTLKTKHPHPEPIISMALITSPAPSVNSILFAGLQGNNIRTAAIRTQGAAGLSGGDADQ